jgi:VanZ family protein
MEADLGWDKLNHLTAFASLAAVASLGRVGAWVRIALALLAYGALIEVLQSFTGTRSAEWGDLLADGVGIASGLLLAAVVSKLALRLGGQRT